jgi:hypothetical protein
LEVWRAVARASVPHDRFGSYGGPEWRWGSSNERNSISDAEQLLCILLPATSFPAFALDRPDETADDVLDALRIIGDSVELPIGLMRVTSEYMRTYTDEYGSPVFSGGSWFDSADPAVPPTDEERNYEVVESYATSLSLSVATLAFLRIFSDVVRRANLRDELRTLEAMASVRLTAAMVGLLRSFTVFTFDADSTEGQRLVRWVDQEGLPQRGVLERLRLQLRETAAAFQELTIGSGQVVEDVDNPNRLFECGWSWGILRDAPLVQTTEEIGSQREGVAADRPYLYFTRLALAAIAELFTERVRILGLLNEEQYRLSRALQSRWELTHSYWSTVATFGRGRWPLEDMPWRTTDGEESDYFSLMVASMMLSGPWRVRATDADLSRIGSVLAELANRGKVTRRPLRNDPVVSLHAPGLGLSLAGSDKDGGRPLRWVATDFAAQVMTGVLRVAGRVRDTTERARLLLLADEVWDHLVARRHPSGRAENLWDDPSRVFPVPPSSPDHVSWSHTARAVECIVAAADAARTTPPRSERLADMAFDLLSEAEHLFDQELLTGTAAAGPAMRGVLQRAQVQLRRAREVIEDRPGTAAVLAQEVLQELDKLAAARRTAAGGM